MYDAIVIGAGVSGGSAAMLLARRGFHALLVDRASVLRGGESAHLVQLPDVERLSRWVSLTGWPSAAARRSAGCRSTWARL